MLKISLKLLSIFVFRATSLLALSMSLFTLPSVTLAEELVIHAGTLIAVPGEKAQSEMSIVVENGVIKAIEKGFVESDKAIDLSESFVLPGLIDMHAHVTIAPGFERDPIGMLIKTQTSKKAALALDVLPRLEQTLHAGFTTIRNLGDPTGTIFELRDAVNKGLITGPTIIAARTQVTVSGGAYDPHTFPIHKALIPAFDHSGVCDGPAECRKVVRRIIAEGADVVKLRISGYGDYTGQEVLVHEYPDELEAIIDTAHRLGRKVAAHVSSNKALKIVLKAGADTVEHGPITKEGFKLARKAYFTPTIYVQGANKDVFIKHFGIDPLAEAIENTRKAYKAGVPILFGSDSGGVAHATIAKEFAYLVQAGLSNADAIRSATVLAAEALGLSARIGTIEVGKAADLIATNSNPLKDVGSLEKVSFVMKGGKAYKNELPSATD